MVERVPVHQRHIETCGYLREDGLWDIEGRLVDHKHYAFENHDRGVIPEGEPLHEMFLRLTVRDDYEIVAVHAETIYAPYRMCPAIIDNYQHLVGLRIQTGFSRKARGRIGGTAGCTHISEILRVLGTVALQTIRPSDKDFLQNHKSDEVLTKSDKAMPHSLKNTCHVFAEDTAVSKRVFRASSPQMESDEG